MTFGDKLSSAIKLIDAAHEIAPATSLLEIMLLEHVHDVRYDGASHMPQIFLPRHGLLRIQNDFVAREVVHILVRGRPLLRYCPQQRLRVRVRQHHILGGKGRH